MEVAPEANLSVAVATFSMLLPFKMVAVTMTSLAASRIDTLIVKGSPAWIVLGARMM